MAADVLAHYDDPPSGRRPGSPTTSSTTRPANTTGPTSTSSARPHPNLLKDRAFADLWRRSPRPLFGLLERARSDRVRQFAAEALKTDFRASLREVEPSWVARLVGVGSEPVDEFVVWILGNVPKFEQAAFRTLGLHEAVLRLFDSPSDAARAYAAEYARTHARDLPVDELVRLANNDHAAVRRLAADLLQARDPRKEVGLEAWGRLLETQHGHELAAEVLRKHFGARELTPEWFRARLFAVNAAAFKFVQVAAAPAPPRRDARAGLLRRADRRDRRDGTAVPALPSPGSPWTSWPASTSNALDRDFLRRLILRPTDRAIVPATGSTRAGSRRKVLGPDFLKALAFHPDWEADPWLATLRREGPAWARELAFDEALADQVLGWLRDVRRFTPGGAGLRLAAAAGGPERAALPRLRRRDDDQGLRARRLRPQGRGRIRRGRDRRAGEGRPGRGLVPVHRQAGDHAAQGGRGQGPPGAAARWPRA